MEDKRDSKMDSESTAILSAVTICFTSDDGDDAETKENMIW